MVRSIYYSIFFFTKRTQNGVNKQPWQFLNENNIEILVGFQNHIGEKLVLLNILQKNLDIFDNHT